MTYEFEEIYYVGYWWAGSAEICFCSDGWTVGEINVATCEDENGNRLPYRVPSALLASALASQDEYWISSEVSEARGYEPSDKWGFSGD